MTGRELGFQKVGISDINLLEHEEKLQLWLDNNYHGEMDYMFKHGLKRARPAELLPGTLRVISVRMDYLPENACFARTLKNKNYAYISRYALGRDYHKVLRKKLKQLGQKIEQQVGLLGYRPFVDSAPVLERPLAEKAGLGWTGKHSLLIDAKTGSWFFIGELMVDLPLPVPLSYRGLFRLNFVKRLATVFTAVMTASLSALGTVLPIPRRSRIIRPANSLKNSLY